MSEEAKIYVELGGGRNPRGPDWINVDCLDDPAVHVKLDLAAVGKTGGPRLPWDDATVFEVYGSHVLEHIPHYQTLLWEIVRVCMPGARVEIRCPWWCASMALCAGHTHTISPAQVRHWTKDFPSVWFPPGQCDRRLDLAGMELIDGDAFQEAKDCFPLLTDDQIRRFVPDACHEVRFIFSVVPNA